MNRKLVCVLGSIFWLVCFDIGHFIPARADELVWLESAAVKPTPFKERKARERGEILTSIPGIRLRGYLTRPSGNGPFPAVVILHGCSGIYPSVKKTWPQRLTAWGYVALVVDSFSARDIKQTCDKLLVDRTYDAYGALEFLSNQEFVDPERIALMGFSAGGIATLQAVQLGGIEVVMDSKFKAAVAYYPLCSEISSDMTVPTLILVGELDDWTPAMECQKLMKERSGNGSPVELLIYSGAHHGFDSADLQPGIMDYGHWIEYNAVAADRSIADVRHFFAQQLR